MPEIALMVLLEAVLAPTWVWLVLGEVPPIETVYGGALIIGTLALHFTLMTRRAQTGHKFNVKCSIRSCGNSIPIPGSLGNGIRPSFTGKPSASISIRNGEA